jgi:hypothetical protein
LTYKASSAGDERKSGAVRWRRRYSVGREETTHAPVCLAGGTELDKEVAVYRDASSEARVSHR